MYSVSGVKDEKWFFYGTLRDRQVLDLVLGKSSKKKELGLHRLYGHRLYQVKGELFPVLVKSKNENDLVVGSIFKGFSEEDISRLSYFEGEEYEQKIIFSQGLQLHYFHPRLHTYEWEQEWIYEKWREQSEDYEQYLIDVRSYMSFFAKEAIGIWKG